MAVARARRHTDTNLNKQHIKNQLTVLMLESRVRCSPCWRGRWPSWRLADRTFELFLLETCRGGRRGGQGLLLTLTMSFSLYLVLKFAIPYKHLRSTKKGGGGRYYEASSRKPTRIKVVSNQGCRAGSKRQRDFRTPVLELANHAAGKLPRLLCRPRLRLLRGGAAGLRRLLGGPARRRLQRLRCPARLLDGATRRQPPERRRHGVHGWLGRLGHRGRRR